MPDKTHEEFQYCPAHEYLVDTQHRLCNKVDWIIKLMLTNLFAVILTLLSITGGLAYIVLKVVK